MKIRLNSPFRSQLSLLFLLLTQVVVVRTFAGCDGFNGSGGGCGVEGGDEIYFTVTDGLVTISGISGYNGKELVIPTSGLPVVSIGPNAFTGSGVTKVTVPDTVTNIDDYAFYECLSLTNVTMGNGVIRIGRFAFGGCTSLTQVTIPDTVTDLGDFAFYLCSSLTNVMIGNGLTSINTTVFSTCTSLAAISVGPLNAVYSSAQGVLFNKDQTTLILCPEGKTGSYIVPNSVTHIASDAFYNCLSLTNITLPTNLTSIGAGAFEWCGLTAVTIPDSITRIEPYTFQYCGGLVSASIGHGVTNIGGFAFVECHRLADISIPDNVKTIEDNAFISCGLTNATIGNGVTSIGNGAFFACFDLATITLGTSVAGIGVQAFDDCTSLTTINVHPGNASFSSLDGVLFNQNQTTLLQCPMGRAGSYNIPHGVTKVEDTAFLGCSDLTSVVIPNTVTRIGNDSFDGCLSLTTLLIPNGVTWIGDWAFGSCVSLASVTLPSSVTNIGDGAFYHCTSLTNITVAASNPNYSSLNGVLFDKLQTTLIQYPGGLGGSYIIPNSVTGIGNYAFAYCTGLTSAYFQGDAPHTNTTAVTYDNTPMTVYYLPGTSGWGSTFGGVPAVLWNPQAKTFSLAGGHFGFNLTGPANATIVVEACTNLSNPIWLPVSTNTLTGGATGFSDPQSVNYPSRFYRFRAQ